MSEPEYLIFPITETNDFVVDSVESYQQLIYQIIQITEAIVAERIEDKIGHIDDQIWVVYPVGEA